MHPLIYNQDVDTLFFPLIKYLRDELLSLVKQHSNISNLSLSISSSLFITFQMKSHVQAVTTI